ncbi:RecA/RadA recombinase [Thiovulum sp. ES]|nr:RecA/RadA recombinase [Thiovulum sp. ES]
MATAKTTSAKEKALESALKEIDKKFGKHTLIRIGDKEIEKIPSISTGSIGLDLSLGIGGLPVGRVIEIYGPESSGKTTLSLQTIAEAQKKGMRCGFIDAEHAIDIQYAKNLGVDVENLYLSQPDYGEQALEITETMARSGAFDLIVIDSVAALVPKVEIEGTIEDQQVGVQARLMSKALRRLASVLHDMNATVIFINQLRQKIGVIGYGCFHHDTLLNFADGRSLPIGEVVDNKIKGEVFCINEKTGEIETKPITAWHDNGKVEKHEDFIHFQTQSINGRDRFGFTATRKHEILTDSGWKTAEEISFEDKLTSKYLETANGTYGEFLRGVFVGDSRISIRDKNTANLRLQDNSNADYVNWKLDKLQKFLNFNELKVEKGYRYDSEFSYEFAKIKRELGEQDPIYMLENYSPLSLAVWYMDDGSYYSEDYHSRSAISIGRYRNQTQKLNEILEIFKSKTGIDEVSIQDSKLQFTKNGTDKLAEIISKYVPDSMQYKLPKDFRGKYVDFELENSPKLVTDFVEIKEIREASDRQMRNKRKFDISIADNKNYMVGGSQNGVIVHNSNETTTGGNALKFYASIRLDVRRIASLKNGDDIIGNRTKVKIVKNKVAPPFKITEFDIIFGKGVSKVGEVVDYAVKFDFIEKSGAWFSYNDRKIGQGRENAKKFLLDNPEVMKEVEEKVIAKLKPAPEEMSEAEKKEAIKENVDETSEEKPKKTTRKRATKTEEKSSEE